MAGFLRWFGILCLAGAVWLLLAGAGGWVAEGRVEALARTAAMVGIAALAAGIALGFVGRVSRPLTKGRCAKCGVRIERGQVYCLDHLLATVDETRERARNEVCRRRSGSSR